MNIFAVSGNEYAVLFIFWHVVFLFSLFCVIFIFNLVVLWCVVAAVGDLHVRCFCVSWLFVVVLQEVMEWEIGVVWARGSCGGLIDFIFTVLL
jgi:hypothetical protein